MTSRQLIAAASFALLAGPALAADYTPFPVDTASTATRAEVSAQARAAVAAGDVTVGEDALVETAGVALAQRQNVRDDAVLANRRGTLPVGELLSFERRALVVRAG